MGPILIVNARTPRGILVQGPPGVIDGFDTCSDLWEEEGKGVPLDQITLHCPFRQPGEEMALDLCVVITEGHLFDTMEAD